MAAPRLGKAHVLPVYSSNDLDGGTQASMVRQNRRHSYSRSTAFQEPDQNGEGVRRCIYMVMVVTRVRAPIVRADSVILQLVEREKVKAVLSYNEAYELSFFTNSKKVSGLHAAIPSRNDRLGRLPCTV